MHIYSSLKRDVLVKLIRKTRRSIGHEAKKKYHLHSQAKHVKGVDKRYWKVNRTRVPDATSLTKLVSTGTIVLVNYSKCLYREPLCPWKKFDVWIAVAIRKDVSRGGRENQWRKATCWTYIPVASTSLTEADCWIRVCIVSVDDKFAFFFSSYAKWGNTLFWAGTGVANGELKGRFFKKIVQKDVMEVSRKLFAT